MLCLFEGTVNHYTAGTALPSIEKLIALCKILDCDYEDILGQPSDHDL